MKSSHYTCELFSINILLMAYHSPEQKVEILDVYWSGPNDNTKNTLSETLKTVQKLIIIAEIHPHSIPTFVRMIHLLSREAYQLEKEVAVVITNDLMFNAIKDIGFDNFYNIFLTQGEAFENMRV